MAAVDEARDAKRQCLPEPRTTLSEHDELLLRSIDPAIVSEVAAHELQAENDRQNRTAEKRLLRNRRNRLAPVAKTVRSLLLARGKTALPLGELIDQVRYSLANSLPVEEVDATLRLLHQAAPDWCRVYDVGDVAYFRLVKTEQSFHAVLDKLRNAPVPDVQ